jgi:hypothetical protein
LKKAGKKPKKKGGKGGDDEKEGEVAATKPIAKSEAAEVPASKKQDAKKPNKKKEKAEPSEADDQKPKGDQDKEEQPAPAPAPAQPVKEATSASSKKVILCILLCRAVLSSNKLLLGVVFIYSPTKRSSCLS